MKRILALLSSPILMGTLLLLLAASMGIATFVENDFGTNAAKALYYNAWWFEGIFLLLGINMFLNLLKPHLWKKEKLAIVLFHFSFVLIVVGAALTRFIGFEGMMHIREGQTSNIFLSSDTFINGEVTSGSETEEFEGHVFMSLKSKDHFSESLKVDGHKVSIKSVDYIPNAELVPVEDENGVPMISLVVSTGNGRNNLNLTKGEGTIVGGYTIGFEYDGESDFNIYIEDDVLYFSSPHSVFSTNMATKERTDIDMDKQQVFYQSVLLGFEDLFIIQTGFFEKASFKAVPSQNKNAPLQAVALDITVDNRTDRIYLTGSKDEIGEYSSKTINGVNVKVRYGAKLLETPFTIKLNEFQLERYPGSDSPSSFASEVTLIDNEKNVTKDFRIFMNNILNYRGYRFYQSSYDTDEKGTVLSVNNDLWGTTVTYIGYALLALFMILSLFSSKSRFQFLLKQITELSKEKKALMIIGIFLIGGNIVAQDIKDVIVVDKEQAQKFGELWVQDNGGRIKPMNTMSGEILRKLVKHNSYKGYSADQVALSMLIVPEKWAHIPLITVKEDPVRDIVGNVGKKASFAQFFDESGTYKLSEMINEAYRTRPAYRNKLQNELIKIDEQVNVFYLAQSGTLLRIFPDGEDVGIPWITPLTTASEESLGEKASAIKVYYYYINALKNKDTEEADKLISALATYQSNKASSILSSDRMKHLEIFYNKSNIFLMLAPFIFIIGLILLLLQLVFLFLPNNTPKAINITGMYLILICFIVYTAGLAMRWYISGHAPWSNGYESMLYIGWSILLAGIVFTKQSPMVLSVGSFFSGIVLFVAHLSWMNPEITNLVPVLKSYWLTIHVAIIVGSYGFLSLASLMSLVALLLMGLQKAKGDGKVKIAIKELSYVSELGLTIGLYTLTIGAFLGGVWANESWGRYWGWDPKETWSMVTILIYAFVLHMRMIPGVKNLLWYNVAAVIGFFSVVMTYLGVNYYLAGMHSYAKGDPVPIPSAIYYMVITVFVVVIFAIINQRKLKQL
ncbi:cytochrome c biogenesis protein [Saccharicrinis aurantiacus]|uniref:cytochrome c biogenesis protein n=1 Tax=Saccharicrinis aurantiacus TaxID=1849719 RepID=UPI000838B3C4|nr:cytochrome c biogenesis protein CcsA [Saccharicrinis aurantiacus]